MLVNGCLWMDSYGSSTLSDLIVHGLDLCDRVPTINFSSVIMLKISPHQFDLHSIHTYQKQSVYWLSCLNIMYVSYSGESRNANTHKWLTLKGRSTTARYAEY